MVPCNDLTDEPAALFVANGTGPRDNGFGSFTNSEVFRPGQVNHFGYFFKSAADVRDFIVDYNFHN
jgi:hypothetical protein